MRLSLSLLSLLYLTALQCRPVHAGPIIPKDESENSGGVLKLLFGRQSTCGGTLCGYYNQLCCTNGEKCYTDLQTKAHCSTVVPAATLGAVASQGGDSWSYSTYTTTNQQVITVTTSYYMGAAPTTAIVASTASCSVAGAGCGAICCDLSYQSCGPTPGQCVTISASNSFVAPLRGTSSGSTTTMTAAATTTMAATTTDTFAAAIGTSGATYTPIASTTSGGLSAGAIAGIVIGVIVGIILLLLICFCCILKAGFDGILSLLGLRNRRKTERTEITEERYSRHGSGTGASRRDEHRGWFGTGRGSRTRVTEKRDSGLAKEGGIIAGIAAGLAGLWLLLGLRKKKEHRSNVSEVSYETYTDSYTGTSASSASSDRRTRDSRRVSRPPRSSR